MRSLEKPSELKQGQVIVWFTCIDRPLTEIREFVDVISPEETARAKRFRSAQDRDRYIVQHGILRSLLAGYLGCGPRQVDIRSGVHGKPCLVGKDGGGSLEFSLSHSGAYAAFAIGRCKRIGVDIEEIREIPEMEGIVAQHFTPREKAEMLACPFDVKLKTFYRFWTRKEAVLKAQGEGLLKALDNVDVGGGEGAGPLKVGLAGKAGVEEFWVTEIEGPLGYAVAVAAEGPGTEILIRSLIKRT